jgi:hypothetical protein
VAHQVLTPLLLQPPLLLPPQLLVPPQLFRPVSFGASSPVFLSPVLLLSPSRGLLLPCLLLRGMPVLLLGPTMVVARTEFPIVLRRTVSVLSDIAHFRTML